MTAMPHVKPSRLDPATPLLDELAALLGDRLSTSPAVRERRRCAAHAIVRRQPTTAQRPCPTAMRPRRPNRARPEAVEVTDGQPLAVTGYRQNLRR